MKILKESKSTLPTSFITELVSTGWERVGVLKEQINAIESSFSDATKVTTITNELLDAYLIYLGQLEEYLATDKQMEIPEADEIKENSEVQNPVEEVIESPIEEVPTEVAVNQPIPAPEKDATGVPFEYYCEF